MKRFTILAMFVAMVLSVSAQYKMQVWMNGTPLNLPVSLVDSVTFLNEGGSTPNIPDPNPTPDPSTAGGIGVFSVADGKTVSFAPGNLQFNAAEGSHLRADGTAAKGTWRFAENQWDYVGKDNKYIGENYEGWIDLFGWGTSGYDNTANDPYAMFYQPWSKSNVSLSSIKKDSTLNCDAYEITGECEWEYTYFTSSEKNKNYYGYGPSLGMADVDLVGTSANYDWGVYNAICNGGNKAGLWRTLTRAEWSYILESRKNAQFLCSQATVNGVYGYVLLPDDFKKPAEINWSHQANNWSTNTYTVEQWKLLEATGAIFLPAAGYRGGTDVTNVLIFGYYRSATMNSARDAYSLLFGSDRAYVRSYDRRGGQSVRLVKDL